MLATAGTPFGVHGRRNFSLRADGVLAVVCPATDDSHFAGVCIFAARRASWGKR